MNINQASEDIGKVAAGVFKVRLVSTLVAVLDP